MKVIIKAGTALTMHRTDGRRNVAIVLPHDVEVETPAGWDDPVPEYMTKYPPLAHSYAPVGKNAFGFYRGPIYGARKDKSDADPQ